jgi:hypothetical protein
MSQNNNTDFLKTFLRTNFTGKRYRETLYGEIFKEVHGEIFGASKLFLLILVCILCTCSIIGSIANMFFICIFKLIFNKKFNHKIQSKLAETSIGYELKERSTQCDLIEMRTSMRQIRDRQSTELYENYIQLKNKLSCNSSLKILYTFIYYLAIVDLFTCLFALPVTAYEIWYSDKINEFCCRLFEFMRSFGVVLSNFLIILIAVEQFKALSANMKRTKQKQIFYVCIIKVLLSVLLSIILMLEISVYQRYSVFDEDMISNGFTESFVVYVGFCLISEYTINFKVISILNILMTSIFVIGGIFVAILYVIIFFKSFSLIQRQSKRKKNEKKILNKAKNNSRRKNHIYTQVETEFKTSSIGEKSSNTENQQSCSFYHKPSFRVAIMIFLVTFIYWLSIIPWFLTLNKIIEYNPFIHYAFLLKSVFNPIIYGLLNPNLRNCGFNLIKLFFVSIKNKF